MRLALCVLLAGCELIANIPTPANTDGGGTADGGDAAMRECSTNSECMAADEPICATAIGACRGCVADAECPAGVCLADGSCPEATRFVYAAAGGNGTTCSLAQPCSIDTAVTQLTPEKDIVKLAPGTYTRAAGIEINLAGTLAGTGSTLQMTNIPMGTTAITIGAVPVSIVGLTVVASANVSGLRCQNAGGSLTLSRVSMQNASTGIYALDCPLVVDRSRVFGSLYYAIYAANAEVTVRNTYLTNNGNPTYTLATLNLNNVPSGVVEHVTFSNNQGSTAGALQCVQSAGVTVRNIVSWNNAPPGIDPNCVVSHSVVETTYTGGTANLAMDPQFLSPMSGDYGLTPGSPAAGVGDPSANVSVDVDGELRPQPAGSNPDPGADEIP